MITVIIKQLDHDDVVKKFTVEDAAKIMTIFMAKQNPLPMLDKQGRLWDRPNVRSTMTLEEYNRATGGYVVPAEYVRDLKRIDAYWTRRERKARRRYQHQKRKQ